ncbi:MAG: metallophosphoesterase family protein [Planctomycetes bacterium]|nr:metallophosphoesterase family protein [Planctomycetota bacterium]
MRYAVLADVHANLEALEAVLEEIQKEKIDKIVCLGDVVGYGANPTECIAKLRSLNTCVVAGNHDFATIDKLNVDFFNSYAREAALWTRKVLTKEDAAYLGTLKLVDTVDNFMLVHSTLYSPELFEYIQTSYDAHLSFSNMATPLCFLGHSHVPVTFIQKRMVTFTMEPKVKLDANSKTMVNVGSVGQPRDENPEAAFAIYDSDDNMIWIRRVKYDIEKAARKIIKAGLPEILAERLRYGR